MQRGEFLGFFSTVKSVIDGDSGFSVKKIYWYVWDAGALSVSVQMLGPDFKPAGQIMPLSRHEFENSFSPEPDMGTRPEDLDQDIVRFVTRNMEKNARQTAPRPSGVRSVSGSAPAFEKAPADSLHPGVEPDAFRLVENAEKPDAAMSVQEFERRELARRKRLCRIAEEKVRTLFIRDLDEFLQGMLGPEAAFKAPLEVKADWLPEYKHMFSQLAVRLRKLKLYRRAIDYHSRALELAPGDYHIYFNMACVHYALGDIKNTVYWLNQILAVAPDMELARRFLEYVSEHEASPEADSGSAASAVLEKDGLAATAEAPASSGRPAASGITRVSDPSPRVSRIGRSGRS